MTQWNYCPECTAALVPGDDGNPSCPKGHFTYYPNPAPASLALVRNKGEYLVMKRSKAPKKDFWDLPGGFVDPGETFLEALIREIKEETNLDVAVVQFLGSYPSIYGDTGKTTIAEAYLFEAANRRVELSEENSEHKWVLLKDMP
jgi:NAD+ diphosphatase